MQTRSLSNIIGALWLAVVSMLSFHIARGQPIQKGSVSYEIMLSNADGKLIEDEIKRNPRLPMVLDQVTFTLMFTDSQAMFSLDENVRLSQSDLKEVEAFFVGVSSDRYFWQDRQAAYHTVKTFPMFNEEYLLVDSFENGWHTGWEITNESKEIAGYTCFKAVRDNLGVKRNGIAKRYPVVAWFCPELPFAFGPMKYGGLPGLILEVQTHLVLFGARSIDLGKDGGVLPKPDLQIVTEEDFYVGVDKKMTEIRKGKKGS